MSQRGPQGNERVVIVGAGNAALVTALAVHEAGAEAVVLEAAPRAERGGNSRFAGATFRFAHDGLDDLVELLDPSSLDLVPHSSVEPFTREDYFEDLLSTSDGRANRDHARILVDEGRDTVAWMRDQGVRWELSTRKFIRPDQLGPDDPYVLPPGACVRAVHEGVGLTDDLFAAVEAAGIEVRYDTAAADLITEGTRVHGVTVRGPDGTSDLTGQVVLAAGGFEANPEMRLRYLGEGWDLVKVRGTRFNRGRMLEAALRAGAQAIGHWGGCHATPVAADAPDVGSLDLTDSTARHSYPYGLLVNRQGDRFVDEGEKYYLSTYAKTGAAIRAQPGAWAAQVFDQRTLHVLQPRYSTQTPVTAETIPELARLLGIPAESLQRTVDRFNDAVTGDPQLFDANIEDGLGTKGLQPPKSNWAMRLDQPPFVAYPVTAGITFTYGGLAIDVDGRVLDDQGRPMPGLHATGEITGGLFFHNYPGGAGLMRGAVFGRRAARAAVAALG
jgi:tricarballylate dehydrogenase